MKDWDKVETLVVLALLCLGVFFTYLYTEPVVLQETEFQVDNQ